MTWVERTAGSVWTIALCVAMALVPGAAGSTDLTGAVAVVAALLLLAVIGRLAATARVPRLALAGGPIGADLPSRSISLLDPDAPGRPRPRAPGRRVPLAR